MLLTWKEGVRVGGRVGERRRNSGIPAPRGGTAEVQREKHLRGGTELETVKKIRGVGVEEFVKTRQAHPQSPK